MRISRKNLFLDQVNGSTKNMTITKRQSGEHILHGRRGPNTKGLSEKQQIVKDIFLRAAAYARAAMDNPEKKAIYAAAVRPNFNAYTLAVADMLRAPKVSVIDAGEYKGEVGQKLLIVATDDFKVVVVKVAIHGASGDLIETGDAVLHENGIDWIYAATVANNQLAGTKITATAFDIPNNSGSFEVTLP